MTDIIIRSRVNVNEPWRDPVNGGLRITSQGVEGFEITVTSPGDLPEKTGGLIRRNIKYSIMLASELTSLDDSGNDAVEGVAVMKTEFMTRNALTAAPTLTGKFDEVTLNRFIGTRLRPVLVAEAGSGVTAERYIAAAGAWFTVKVCVPPPVTYSLKLRDLWDDENGEMVFTTSAGSDGLDYDAFALANSGAERRYIPLAGRTRVRLTASLPDRTVVPSADGNSTLRVPTFIRSLALSADGREIFTAPGLNDGKIFLNSFLPVRSASADSGWLTVGGVEELKLTAVNRHGALTEYAFEMDTGTMTPPSLTAFAFSSVTTGEHERRVTLDNFLCRRDERAVFQLSVLAKIADEAEEFTQLWTSTGDSAAQALDGEIALSAPFDTREAYLIKVRLTDTFNGECVQLTRTLPASEIAENADALTADGGEKTIELQWKTLFSGGFEGIRLTDETNLSALTRPGLYWSEGGLVHTLDSEGSRAVSSPVLVIVLGGDPVLSLIVKADGTAEFI